MIHSRVANVRTENFAVARSLIVLALAILLASCASSDTRDTPVAQSTTTATTPTTAASAPATTSSTTTSTTPSTTEATEPAPTIIVAVPESSPPAIDGVLGDGEWSAAVTDTMTDGASVHFMSSAGVLYVAVAGDDIGAVNVLLATDTEVRVLHSSAALGSALYIASDSIWELDHGFDWCCRSDSDDSARLDLYEKEGWQANIGFTGNPGIVEFAIGLPWSGAALVISSIRDEEDKGFWPAALSEESRDELLGTPPPERTYDIATWPHLTDDAG